MADFALLYVVTVHRLISDAAWGACVASLCPAVFWCFMKLSFFGISDVLPDVNTLSCPAAWHALQKNCFDSSLYNNQGNSPNHSSCTRRLRFFSKLAVSPPSSMFWAPGESRFLHVAVSVAAFDSGPHPLNPQSNRLFCTCVREVMNNQCPSTVYKQKRRHEAGGMRNGGESSESSRRACHSNLKVNC